jgi:hypothetical protein
MWPKIGHGVKLPFYALQSGSLDWVGEGGEGGVLMQGTATLSGRGRRSGCCNGIGLKTVIGGRRKRGGGEGNGMT